MQQKAASNASFAQTFYPILLIPSGAIDALLDAHQQQYYQQQQQCEYR
jgi:hypothetical protein